MFRITDIEPIDEVYEFTINELRTVYELIKNDYIPYENEAAHSVINRIMAILRQNDSKLPRRNS